MKSESPLKESVGEAGESGETGGTGGNKIAKFVLVLFIVFCFVVCFMPSPFAPEQIHVSLGRNDREYYVTWATEKPTECFLIWYVVDGEKHSPNQVGQWVRANPRLWKNEPPVRKGFTTYTAKMLVEPNKTYEYKIIACQPQNFLQMGSRVCEHLFGSGRTYSSPTFKFRTRDLTLDSHKVIFYGDLGVINGQSIPRIIEEVNRDMYSIIIHNGDFAYDLNTHNGRLGDRFMYMIEPIASKVPYQTSVGNHEIANNFSHYDYRFTMINGGGINHGMFNNFYYSFNLGPVHFVAFSTEFYYFLDYTGIEPLVNQYDWLKRDLALASSPAERQKRPWIIVFGHRPMYCSSRDRDDCSKDTNILRKGLPFTNAYALEKLFYDFGVDVEIYSHEHQYERFLPIFNGQIFNGSYEEPYVEPLAPVHIISGSAGCQERLDPFKGHAATGSVKRISDYGYSRLYTSRCALRFEQVSDDQSGDIVDSFIIKKSRQNFPRTLPDLFYGECQS